MTHTFLTDRPSIMGIINVTPDSFSDGGKYYGAEQAVLHGLKLLEEGADILDVGGESTRPGAPAVSADEEMARVIPVIEGLAASGKAAHISIDTRHAATMRAAVHAGATIINDVSALEDNPESLETVAALGVPVCLMHKIGAPRDMAQNTPKYDDVCGEIISYLNARIDLCIKAGIEKSNIVLDPGIGFNKTVEDNLNVLRNLERFTATGYPVLIGASRKRFIGQVTGVARAEDRLAGSLAVAFYAVQKGAHILRVHDVAETRQMLEMYAALI